MYATVGCEGTSHAFVPCVSCLHKCNGYECQKFRIENRTTRLRKVI